MSELKDVWGAFKDALNTKIEEVNAEMRVGLNDLISSESSTIYVMDGEVVFKVEDTSDFYQVAKIYQVAKKRAAILNLVNAIKRLKEEKII